MRLLLGKWGNTKDRLISNLFQRATADGGVLGSSIACIDAAYSSADNSSLLTMVPAFGKAGKLYSIIPESGAGDFTVVRGTTGAYVGQDGLIRFAAANEPRFDWTNGCPVVLIQPAATNLFLRSQEFDNAYWTKVNGNITANTSAAPDGTTTADKFVPTASSGQHRIDRSVTLISGSHVFSVFLKADGYNFASLRIGSSGVAINLSNGVLGSPTSGITANVNSFGNGWYRLSISGITGTQTFRINAENALSIGTDFVGNGTSGILVWGAQLETGSVATSYIQTVAAAATRNADVITVAPPAGTSEIVTTFEDGTTQVVTSIPGTFTIPNGRVAKVKMT